MHLCQAFRKGTRNAEVRRRRGKSPTPSGPNDAEDDVDSLTQGMGDVTLDTEGKTDTSGEWRAKLPDSATVPVAQPVRTGEGFHKFSRTLLKCF